MLDRVDRSQVWRAAERRARQHLAVPDVAGTPRSQLPAGVTISGVTYGSESLTSTGSYNSITVNPLRLYAVR